MLMGVVANIVALFGGPQAVFVLGRFWARTLTAMAGFEIEVEGRENFHTGGPVVVLLNHQGYADIPTLYLVSPVPLGWMAKHTLFRIPIFGQAMRAAGAIPVVRDDRKRSMQSLFAAAEAVRAGQTVVIFPEGTRSHNDGSMRSFKKGAFVLAKKAGVTLQPITLWGSYKATPHGDGNWLPRLVPTTIYVKIHEPIPPERIAALSSEQLAQEVRTVLERPMDRLRAFHDALG